MHTKIHKCIIISMILIMNFSLIGCSDNTEKSASITETSSDTLEEYQLRLRMFNDEHKTNYKLPDDADSAEWLLSLSPEQFEQYLTSVYNGTNSDVEKVSPKNDNIDLGESDEFNIPNIQVK